MRESSGGLSFSPRSNTPSSTTRAAPTEDADFLSRLPEPATEHDRSGSSSLTPVDDDGIFVIRACGLSTRSSRTPGVGLVGPMPHFDNAVLGGFTFHLSDFRDSRAHGPRRIDGLCAPSGRPLPRVSAAVTTINRRRGRGAFFPAADIAFARLMPCFLRAAQTLQKPPLPRGLSPSIILHRQPIPPRSLIRLRPPFRRLAIRRPRQH